MKTAVLRETDSSVFWEAGIHSNGQDISHLYGTQNLSTVFIPIHVLG
jgi:hypothetical protein